MGDAVTRELRHWGELRERKARELNDPQHAQKVAEVRGAIDKADCIASLVAARQRLGYTQTDVADVLGVSKARVSNLEQQSDLYVSTLLDYVKALGGRLEMTAVIPAGDGNEERVLLNT